MCGMDMSEVTTVVENVISLVREQYVDSAASEQIAQALAAVLAAGRYQAGERTLAEAVTQDLQSVNGDPHLRLLYHADPMPERDPGDDAQEYAAMARWASQTCGGIARVQRLEGNVGYLDFQPVLFPAAICGEAMMAAMTLISSAPALIVDVRHCIGGDPAMVALACSYLHGPEPVELTSLHEARLGRVTQSWTLPYVPGRRFGPDRPVYVLTSAATFSGGEQFAYDLQQLKRATIIGERTKGGANAREGFRVQAHLEATIPVARGVNPVSGSNWEAGVMPDIEIPAEQALDHAQRLALEQLAAASPV